MSTLVFGWALAHLIPSKPCTWQHQVDWLNLDPERVKRREFKGWTVQDPQQIDPPKFCIAPDGSKTTFLLGRWEGKFSRTANHWGMYTRYIATKRKTTLPSPRSWQGRSSAKIGLISNCIVSWMAKTNKWLMFMILHKPRTCCSMSDVFHRIGWNEVRAWRTTLNTYTIHVHLNSSPTGKPLKHGWRIRTKTTEHMTYVELSSRTFSRNHHLPGASVPKATKRSFATFSVEVWADRSSR